jgi:hypothetical protein
MSICPPDRNAGICRRRPHWLLPGSPADCYRKIIEFIHQHPDQYDPDFEQNFQSWIAELDPPAAT